MKADLAEVKVLPQVKMNVYTWLSNQNLTHFDFTFYMCNSSSIESEHLISNYTTDKAKGEVKNCCRGNSDQMGATSIDE